MKAFFETIFGLNRSINDFKPVEVITIIVIAVVIIILSKKLFRSDEK